MRQLIYICSLLFSTFSTYCFAQQPIAKPNIVFILADDLGYADIGAYGQQHIETPHLDRLAQAGLKFTQFYAGSTVCAPSRSALLSGQHTGHTYIRGNKEIEPEGQHPLADSVQTFAMLLQQAGYATGAFGKWGLGMVGTSGDPNNKGFDTFFGYNCQRQSHRYYPTHLWHNDQRVELVGNDLSAQRIYAADVIQEQTLKFIDTHQDTSFFLFVPTILPHAELAGPADSLYHKYADLWEETPHKGQDYGPNASIAGYTSVDKPRAMFASMVNRLDEYVGQIVHSLEQKGLLDNTLIIVSSDNGAHLEGGADPDFFNSTANLRGRKRDLYEGGIRVPLIVHWPAKITGGQVSDHVAAAWDIMPTLAELTGAEQPRYTDGLSLLPTWISEGQQAQHDYLYWEFHEAGGRQAVRQHEWKLIVLQAKDAAKRQIELYNLLQDPSEQNDLTKQYPDKVRELLQLIKEAHEESPIFPFHQQP